MTGYFALLRLQFLSRFADLKPRNIAANFRDHKGKTVGMAIAYVFLFVYLGGFLIFAENAILDVLLKSNPPMPDLLLTVAVSMGMLSTLVLSFFFIMSSLYFGRDNAFIASLPVTPRTVLAAKLTQVWLSETGVSALFILPAGILYMIRVGADALFALRLLLVWAGIAVLPIVIITWISTLLIRFSALWKRREIVATVSGIAFMVAYMFFAMNLGGSIGGGEAQDMIAAFISSNTSRIQSLTRFFPPAGWAARGLLGDWGQLALFLAVCALAMAVTVWGVGFFYQKLALLQSETPSDRKKTVRQASDAAYSGGSVFKACVTREIRQLLRVPSYATNTLPTAFMPLLMTGMMAVLMGRTLGEEGETIQGLLSGLNGALIVGILTAVMSYMASMNTALSTAVTREGRGHAFLTALPIPPRTSIMAKLAVGYGLSLLGCLSAAVLLAVLYPAVALHALLAAILTALFCYATGCIVLRRDILHPKLNWLTEQEAIKQHFGVLIGMLLGWGLLIALGVLSYFLITWDLSMYAYFAVIGGILLLLCLVSHRLLMKTADEKYLQTEF